MWNWIRRAGRRSPAAVTRAVAAPARLVGRRRSGRLQSGPYRLLHDYLRERYADTVVLTFEQIEDLGGFPLPPEALQRRGLVDPDQRGPHRRASVGSVGARQPDWRAPNLQARTVVFDRLA